MMKLAQIQQALQDYLLDKQTNLEELTLETPAFPREERLQIYHQAYRLRLIDALRNDYPALEQFLGEEKFIQACSSYLEDYPSHHPSLRWLGKDFPRFLKTSTLWQSNLSAAELAEFEWAQVTAFDAADEPLATLDDVRALAPEAWLGMRLEVHPSIQIVRFFTNAPAVWYSLIKEETEAAPEISSEENTWLIWREDLQVVYRPLHQSEVASLDAFLQGKNFSDVCSLLCEWFAEEEVPMRAAQYLQQWINAGLITQIIS